jgi:hypothetical protein
LGKSEKESVPQVPAQFIELIQAVMKQNNLNEKFNIDEVVIQVKKSWNQTKDTIRKRDNKVKTEPVIEIETKADI